MGVPVERRDRGGDGRAGRGRRDRGRRLHRRQRADAASAADADRAPGKRPLAAGHAAAPVMLGADGAEVDWFKVFLGFGGMVIGQFMAMLDIQIVASSLVQIQSGIGATATLASSGLILAGLNHCKRSSTDNLEPEASSYICKSLTPSTSAPIYCPSWK